MYMYEIDHYCCIRIRLTTSRSAEHEIVEHFAEITCDMNNFQGYFIDRTESNTYLYTLPYTALGLFLDYSGLVHVLNFVFHTYIHTSSRPYSQ